MKLNKKYIFIFCITFFLFGCGKSRDLVEFSNITITNKDLHQAYRQEIITAHNEASNKITYTPTEIKQKAADNLTIGLLLYKEYDKHTVTQEEIDKLKQILFKLAGSKEEFLRQNELTEYSEEDLRHIFELKLKRKKILQQAGRYKLSNDELKTFYKNNIHLYTFDETYEIYHILAKTNYAEIKNRLIEQDKTNKIKNEELIKLIREEVKKNTNLIKKLEAEVTKENFEEMAKIYSQDPDTASKGGYIGTIKAYEAPSEAFIGQIVSQEPGTISPITKTKFGSHLIYIKNKTPYIQKTFEQVKDDVWLRAMDEKEYDLTLNYIKEIKNETKIIYHDKTLEPSYVPLKDKISKFFRKKTRKNNETSNK